MQAPFLTKALIPFARYSAIGFQIGTIVAAEPFEKARNPSYKVTVDFNGRLLTTSAQLPPNYPDLEFLFDKQVVGVTNLPERKIAGFRSQCLIVGFPDENHHVHLLNTRGRKVPAGLPLDMTVKVMAPIVYDDFAHADIQAATIDEMTQMRSDENSYLATVDVGPLGKRRISIVDIDRDIATELQGTQIAVVLNIKTECNDDGDTHVLTFTYEGKRIPLGIDKIVNNGVALF